MQKKNSVAIKKNSLITFFIATAFLGLAISYGNVYFYHITLIFLFFVFLASTNGRITYNKVLTNYHWFFFIFILWYLIIILWSINKLYAFMYLIYIILGSIIALTIIFLVHKKKDFYFLIKVLITLSLINLFIGLFESFTVFRMPVSPFSKLLPYFGRPARNWMEYTDAEIRYLFSMPTGFNWNPNNFATFVNLVFPFFLLHRKRWVKVLGFLFCLILIIQTGSRGNMIAYAVILCFYMLFLPNGKLTFFSLIKTLFWIFLILFIITYLLPYLIKAFGVSSSKLLEINTIFESLKVYLDFDSTGEASVSVRSRLIVNGINALRETMGRGIGGGNSLVIQQNLGMKTQSMHNFWIEVLVEAGVLFFIYFIVWYLKLTIKLLRLKCNDIKITYWARGCGLSLIGFIPGAVSPSSVIYFFPMYILLGLSVWIVNYCKLEKHENIARE